MNPKEIIIRPVITERSMKGLSVEEGVAVKYTFEVAKKANKIEIAKAVEACFPDVKVIKVNTMHVRGRHRRQGRFEGTTPAWKKAIVTVSPDSKHIEFFEGLI